MPKRKVRFIEAPCQRGCGKNITTLKNSLWGASKEIKTKYELICANCLTPSEREEMMKHIEISIIEKLKGA